MIKYGKSENKSEELNPRALEANFGLTMRTLYTIMSGNNLEKTYENVVCCILPPLDHPWA